MSQGCFLRRRGMMYDLVRVGFLHLVFHTVHSTGYQPNSWCFFASRFHLVPYLQLYCAHSVLSHVRLFHLHPYLAVIHINRGINTVNGVQHIHVLCLVNFISDHFICSSMKVPRLSFCFVCCWFLSWRTSVSVSVSTTSCKPFWQVRKLISHLLSMRVCICLEHNIFSFHLISSDLVTFLVHAYRSIVILDTR